MTQVRQCRSCGAPKARDNRDVLCGTCQRRALAELTAPPDVPPEFWESEAFVEAFAAQHIGKVCRAYREHPFHHALHGPKGISQAMVAGWVGRTQAQVSRIESGPPVRNLDTLVHWARTLRVPSAYLWFEMPGDVHDRVTPLAGVRVVQGSDSLVAVSKNEWRLTRRFLNGSRAELAGMAADLYRPEIRLAGTNLLTARGWMPDHPVEMGQVSLCWREGPSDTVIRGTEPEAQLVCPLRSPTFRYECYTSAIRYVDAPTLFENRPSYRLLQLGWEEGQGAMTFGLATYFDKLDVSEAIGHELAKAVTDRVAADGHTAVSWDRLPFRRLVGDPFDLASRAVVPAITTLTLIRHRMAGAAAFMLHWRDPARVATAGGQYDVIPAGEFQPSSVTPWSQAVDLDLWRNVVREYSEELCGTPEHDGSRSEPVDYEAWPFYRTMSRNREAGRIRTYCLGVGLDALTLAATIPTVVVIDEDAFGEIFGDVVPTNAEGITVMSLADQETHGIPFVEQNVRRFLTEEPMAPPGAACLALAWKHRDMLLA